MNIVGIELDDIPETTTPLEAVVLIRGIDDEGGIVWYTRTSKGLNAMERLGMLAAEVRNTLGDLGGAWEPDG